MIVLDGGDGQWFDLAKAKRFGTKPGSIDSPEDRTLAGHSVLFRTHKGAWVIYAECPRVDKLAAPLHTFVRTDAVTAVSFLVRNGHEVPDDLKEALASLEV